MYQMLKRINEALEEYEQVLKIDPEHSGALVNLSTLYCQAGRASESEMLCRLASKNDSGSSEIWNNLEMLCANRDVLMSSECIFFSIGD